MKPEERKVEQNTSVYASEVTSGALKRRHFLKSFTKASVGTVIFLVSDFGQKNTTKIALAQSSENTGVSAFNLSPRLLYDYLSPALKGIGTGIGEFYRGIGEGAGSIARKTGEGIGEIPLGIGEGLRERLRYVISGEKARQKFSEYSQKQDAQTKLELIELIRDSMREFQDKAIDLKIKEIQGNWDLENWNGIISRKETEDILTEQKDCLLILLSPPRVSQDAPSSIRNNLEIELESTGTFLAQYYPERDKKHQVEFYSGYFKHPVSDINLEQLYKILAPIPTATIYINVTDYTCDFNVGYWGLNNSKISIFSSQTLYWERAKKKLISQGLDEIEALRMIRQSIVIGSKLLAAYTADIYYLNLDPYYQLQFARIASALSKEGLPQDFIRPYIDELKDLQKQIQQVYDKELKITADDVKEQETIKANAQKWRLVQTFLCSASVRAIAISPDGETFASGDDDKDIVLWDIKTRTLIRTLKGHSSFISSLAFSPDGQTLASGSWDNTIKLWNLKIYTLTGQSAVRSIAFSPDGQTLASASDDKSIKLWNLKTKELIRTITGHSNIVYSIAFSPDGQTIASGSFDKTVKLWDLNTGQLVRTFTGHSDWLMSVIFSPDGQTIASGSNDNTIKMWDLKKGDLIFTLEGHSNDVNSIAFSYDGKIIASGSEDTTIKLWSAKTGALLRTLEGHSEPILSIAFSQDGHTLISASKDKTVKIWQNI
ncbi:hypothetical protein DSM106972_097870 [Dulcicalothrix desertica PCC 7102]|uniref:Anaphase-promoting complex subunit 4 WD40 domain-containing protein n=1 Tax=Dulcicalothrix desertica PCC 7102 TaxID=232991 RepID=A0A3S1C003_9CYAN|nr:WD40 repeat domain-containing protein [Dulcicalothrix desertica]RUS92892.1 hypothetical protein DSM106972_097870 [Dulcicalothrix desertica PCC 7102]TWH61439.1 FOG: WD40 repeat [Dulcicalothrix desertica PCC 7102]